MELIIMLFVSIAPFTLAAQSIAQNHWIMTSMAESDQKDSLVQTHTQVSVSSTISPTHNLFEPSSSLISSWVYHLRSIQQKHRIFGFAIFFALKYLRLSLLSSNPIQYIILMAKAFGKVSKSSEMTE